MTFENNECRSHGGTVYSVEDQPPHTVTNAATVAAASSREDAPFATLFDIQLPIFKQRVVFRNNVASLGEGNRNWGIGVV